MEQESTCSNSIRNAEMAAAASAEAAIASAIVASAIPEMVTAAAIGAEEQKSSNLYSSMNMALGIFHGTGEPIPQALGLSGLEEVRWPLLLFS